ncbi:MAG: cupredoxin domain-containing protein [Pseudomonadota bacterium]
MHTIQNMLDLSSKAITLAILTLTAALISVQTAVAADSTYSMVIQDHRFQPAELVVPAGQKIKLMVENRDSTPEEFESYDLNREKIIAGKSTTTIYVGPLKSGRYRFFGEFNPKTAQGVIIAK